MSTRRRFSDVVKLSIASLLLLCLLPIVAAAGTVQTYPVFSDFDGDNKLDHATIFSEGVSKRIRIAFGKSAWSLLLFESQTSDQGRLASGDVDGDGDSDLIWIGQETGEFITWVGDGRGNFAIDTRARGDSAVLRSILGDGEPRFTDAADDPEPSAVVIGPTVITVRTFAYDPGLLPEMFFPNPPARAPSSALFSVLQQRGPPSRLF
jgi:hypothetical protein